MHKLALVAAFVASALGMAHAAGPKISSARPQKISSARPMGIVAPAPGTLKRYLLNTEGKRVKRSTAHNSQFYKFNQALKANPKAFRKIVLFRGIDTGETAYIPKQPIKGLKGNTAYVKGIDPMFRPSLRVVRLPLF
jgi:hypothetical protein